MNMEEFADVEFCNVETGEYFRVIGVTEERGKPVVLIEKVETDYE